MAPRRLNPVLDDIIDAIDGIEAAVHGKTFEEFQSDWLLRHGVQRGWRSFRRHRVTFRNRC